MSKLLLLVLWQASTSPDVAGYRVYYGYDSGRYSETQDVGAVLFSMIETKVDTIYIVVTAYDTAGNESVFSDEYRWLPNGFKLYPNPVHTCGKLNVWFISGKPDKMFVYDILGRRVQEVKTNSAIASIDISLEPGVYFLRVGDQSRKFTVW